MLEQTVLDLGRKWEFRQGTVEFDRIVVLKQGRGFKHMIRIVSLLRFLAAK